MNSLSDLHSQRPEYQREMIDFSLLKMEELLKYLNINVTPYDPNNIYIGFLDIGKTGCGNYYFIHDSINIDFRSSFNISTYVHELTHAYSSGKRKKSIIPNLSIGFDHFLTHTFNAFNEGVTETITQCIFEQNIAEVEELNKKYKKLRLQYKRSGILSQDKEAEYGYSECGETGSYIAERLLVDALLCLLNYHHLHQENCQKNHSSLKILWEKMLLLYFTGDRKGLFLLIRKIDSDGKIWKLLKNADAGDTSVDNAINAIVDKIRKIYENGYEPNLGVNKFL